MNVLITGDRGYIGSSLARALRGVFNVTSINRDIVDLTNKKQVKEFFNGKSFDVVVHTAIEGGHRLVRDTEKVTHNNLLMFYNILENKNHFDRLIHFSSGGEKYTDTPYGLSKNIITRLVDTIDGFFNLRLFGVFDENELDTRFIKSNLHRYISGEDMVVYRDKYMDFFYMKDLANVVEYYITADRSHLLKSVDCVYNEKYTLSNVVNIINSCSNYRVGVTIKCTELDDEYVGDSSNINRLPVRIGNLIDSIANTYAKLI
jgi:nucleoside-diphosphate-sugar epimerase